MAKRIRVKVTAQDIRLGKKGNCRLCPLARAIRRELDAFVDVDAETVCLGPDAHTAPLSLSLIAQRFIDQFDKGRKVKPHTFYLTLPYLERGANG